MFKLENYALLRSLSHVSYRSQERSQVEQGRATLTPELWIFGCLCLAQLRYNTQY